MTCTLLSAGKFDIELKLSDYQRITVAEHSK